ncbi:phosphatidylinositol mannoside acyltransferase [Streptomonospora nanhaiensis]|uniref:KDO2-lipid IV(A) lauroyltransferase n=1 Tax=Streptomonospora nanhaiensis TaxID=1323731 RepID=A0A853BWE6_9ACTN|nr:phosphatidylinositol mannoside acyltransferase [Streptomonospora nanhaiensis]MBV2364857.1 phosphatidylinositol mannoside acyltransferase [Streptomonospora nanhaiensis]MBX9387175.1 phosphatidylinositol mannoside acyltransferase [Streptomonospora nanhaiensis]NYI98801.1 KDO2-lipid IV(A) lauroyltransferase [Streptomonospora nanhaiensis]
MGLAERASAAVYLLGWRVVRYAPERAGRRAAQAVADHLWRRRGAGVRRLEANLRRVAGPGAAPEHIRALSRAGMRSYLRYFYEVFRLPALPPAEIAARVECTGLERVQEALAAGRGVVAALPHMGNWDLAGAWVARQQIPPTTVAERLRPEALFARFVAFREGLGMEVLPLTGAGNHIAGVLARRLRAGRLVCLLADRDLTATGLEVEFFGEPARLPAGPAVLAERTGAALLPVAPWYDGDLLRVEVHPEIPVPEAPTRAERVRLMTQKLARAFEAAIAAHPEDWHMLQPVFSADTPPGAGEERPRVGSVETSAQTSTEPPAAAPPPRARERGGGATRKW